MSSYKFVVAPPDYPGKVYEYGNRILEHHAVWWEHTGQTVPDGFVIHHKNEIKNDNRFENLELKKSENHTRDHHLIGPPEIYLECGWCSTSIVRSGKDFRFKTSNGQTRFFCSSSHAALAKSKYREETNWHGTASGYGAHRCRCAVCREYNRQRVLRYRSKKKGC